MAEHKRIDEATGTSTVGHEWDGIEELDTPMPRWWLWTFYISIVWGIAYTIWQPAWTDGSTVRCDCISIPSEDCPRRLVGRRTSGPVPEMGATRGMFGDEDGLSPV